MARGLAARGADGVVAVLDAATDRAGRPLGPGGTVVDVRDPG
jgi:hypothetical protein